MISRRQYLLGSAAVAAASQAGAQGAPRNIVISSANGLAACKRAMEYLHAARENLDAVIAGVSNIE